MRLKSWSWIFIPFLVAALRTAGFAQTTLAPATTQIADTIYRAGGATATGTALISWPAFTTSMGDQVPAGSTSAAIASGGALSVSLIPNSGAIPIGTYYTVTYHLDDNSVTRQYWVVPQSATPVRIAAIQSTVMPVSVAVQTASKSYVDTAIAAATTGHPLDSTPLVLKAGDTMSGPLVLPADPVASMQAATKHYVDSTVASHTTASSISGQSPNYVPLATSATTSTHSSRFFENTDTSGVYNGFLMGADDTHCKNTGVVFTRFGCLEIQTMDSGVAHLDGPTENSLTGTFFNIKSFGRAGCVAECRQTQILGDSGVIAHAGIKNVWHSSTSFFGVGDHLFMNWNHNCFGGVAYMSDQGCQLIYNYGGDGINGGHFNDYIPAGKGEVGTTMLDFAGQSGFGCNSPLNQACVPAPGLWMIQEADNDAAGKFIAPTTADPNVPWVSNLKTDQTTLPTVTAWAGNGSLPSRIGSNTQWGRFTPATFTANMGYGVLAAGDKVCVFGNMFEEQTIVSAVSGSTPGAQTITLGLTKLYDAIAVFKGGCHFIQLDAEVALGDYSVAPAVSLDGHSWTYGLANYSGFGTRYDMTPGVLATTFDGGANSGFHAHCGSRVTQDIQLDPYPIAELEPNTCAWADGTIVGTPNLHFSKTDGIVNAVTQNEPSHSVAQLHGITTSIDGMGASGSAIGIENMNAFHLADCTGIYDSWGCGGHLGAPNANHEVGWWSNTFLLDHPPANSIFNIGDHWPGQSSYQVLKDNVWGHDLTLDPSGFHFNRDLFGGSYWGMGIVSGNTGIFAGAGDGGGNNAGVRFTDFSSHHTWLAPCFVTGGGGNTDMCLGHNGDARVGYGLTPDAVLQLGTLKGAVAATDLSVSGHLVSDVNVGGSGGVNQQINFGTNYGRFNIVMYDGGANNHYGWGLTDGTMNFVVPSLAMAGGHFRFRDTGELSGNSVLMVTRAATAVPSAGVFGFTATADAAGVPDAGLSRGAAGALYVGNGTAGDASGSLKAAVYQGPPAAPTGACSVVGWAFSQDGHISFCNGTTWTQKM